jgi:hypothetical protein
MRILLAHNFYQHAGGEDEVFRTESALLRERGHEVHEFTLHNDAINNMSRLSMIRAAVWNKPVHEQIGALVTKHRIEWRIFTTRFR